MMRKVARNQLQEHVLPEAAPDLAPVHGEATTRAVVKLARQSHVNAVIEVMP